MDKKKVLVGMSGGVDSSAAAALLCERGYEVCGCTLRMYDNSVLGEGYGEGGCCSLADVDDAKSVCRKLGIDHITLNFTDDFGRHVMKPFADSYINGETPNPCIECNRHMKFDLMLRRAELLGFDYIATGHYADIAFENGRYLLKRPADRKKDQTYVLYTLTQEQLAHTLFPLYGMDKPAIRKFAEEKGLINSRKPDSQDICFVPDGDYAAFIERYTGYVPQSGDFIDNEGNKIGIHSGIINYTIGQRRGLGVTFGKPVFVTDKDSAKGTVTLSDEKDLFKSVLFLRDVNLISVDTLSEPMRVTAKARYSAREQEAVIFPIENGIMRVEFSSPVRAPAKGQACVFYDGDIVVGGGVIDGAEE
ncbi:MAG: tRNA 2-thiouridine(34) synthase MnmA [Oscillospiraceae bacterium]|nr:tRNA 2-thiouridine(34) synthase MnmA [Oscillospiraceae bacterium]MDY6208340.1 tRNA 2-thiouridine(34) synthase MnmA [Oscillospiraceae bacterium]